MTAGLPESPAPSGQLLHNLLLFGRVLRGLGLHASPARQLDLVAALRAIDLGRKRDVYHAMRCLVVRRHEQLACFDEAFEIFWRRPAAGESALDLRAMGERRRFRKPRFEPSLPGGDTRALGASAEAEVVPALLGAASSYSASEVLRHKDFAELTAGELHELERLLARLAWRLAERRTRRLRSGRGALPDLRRTLRASLRHGGEVLGFAHRRAVEKPRPLILLADVSGSMERYTRVVLLFLYALAEGLRQRVEAFVFGTRLTRVTRHLRGQQVERALLELARAVPDWSGGTRIGAALQAFNFDWARRVPAGAVVLVISDGWDRGEPELLRREMARLQRSCQRLVWLNPLLGAPGYQPLARGMSAALPFVDDFLPVHNLQSLEDLARRLERLDERRAERRQALDRSSRSAAEEARG